MHRGREARLGPLRRRAGGEDGAAAERRSALRARAAIGAAVRWSLAQRGIDPATAVALRVADEASAELAETADPAPRVCAEPPAGGPDLPGDPLARLDDMICGLVERYRDPEAAAPDLARASLAELLAWCIATADAADPR
jgi:hypothetical protein